MDKESSICRRCGRKLRNPHSQVYGMGPICYEKWLKEQGKPKLVKLSSLQTPPKKL